jgi:hypothetical protein
MAPERKAGWRYGIPLHRVRSRSPLSRPVRGPSGSQQVAGQWLGPGGRVARRVAGEHDRSPGRDSTGSLPVPGPLGREGNSGPRAAPLRSFDVPPQVSHERRGTSAGCYHVDKRRRLAVLRVAVLNSSLFFRAELQIECSANLQGGLLLESKNIL